MRQIAAFLVSGFFVFNAQSQSITPKESDFSPSPLFTRDINSENDTITFDGYVDGSVISNQYQEQGFLFSGFDGSTAPVVADYGNTYGLVLRSSDWFSGFRIDFVQPQDTALNVLASKIEFDNLVSVTETDYVAVNVYNAQDQLIHHYMSISPEHVSIQLPSSSAAYFTVDDSSGTAYILDNFHIDGLTLGFGNSPETDFSLSPNPSPATTTIISKEIITEVQVMTLQGQLVYQSRPFSRNTHFQVQTSGLYLVSVSNGRSVTTKKIVVNY